MSEQAEKLLSKEDLRRLTGFKHVDTQREMLDVMGIPYIATGNARRPHTAVLWADVDAAFARQREAA